MYGYQDSNEVTPGKSGGKFGLNSGVNVIKFEYNPNAGKDESEQDAIDFHVKIDEKEYRKRFFPVSKVFAKGGGEITDTNSQEYKDELAKSQKLLNAELTDIAEAFVGPESVKEALSVPINSFKDFAEILERLVKSVPNWDKKEVDVFLQYQWKPTGENTRTFLELPKNVKHGSYITSTKGGGFKEDRTETHLKYVSEDGITHPFKRNEWFVNHAFANVTNLEGGNESEEMNTQGNSQPAGW